MLGLSPPLHVSAAATEISELNIRAGEVHRELHALRAEEGELREGVRKVEEEVGRLRRERERESRSKMADLQAEIIRLKRELEVCSTDTHSAECYTCMMAV